MIRRLAGSVLALTLFAAPLAFAHQGHTRKVMGTVTMVAADHVMVKTTDGKEHKVSVNGTTKVLHGTMSVKVADLQEGTRVVITATGDKEPYAAKAIQVRRPNQAKYEPYESGIAPTTAAFDTRFSVRYFLIAVRILSAPRGLWS